jgi:hypothetical protein
MIPVHSIHQMIAALQGGTTRPWLALVDDGDEWPRPYVVKFFKEKDYQHSNHLAAEVAGSVLCAEFDIATPEHCLVRMPVLSYANCPMELREYLSKDSYLQPWFGSISMLPAPEFSAALHSRFLMMEEVATIFAFDCLVHNQDRRRGKPNLLMKDDHVWAIDHDKAFAHHRPSNGNLAHYGKGHLFYQRLKLHCKKHGCGIFDTFAESLRLLNLQHWHASLDQLEQLERPFVCRSEWESYLLDNKRNAAQFVSLLCNVLK